MLALAIESKGFADELYQLLRLLDPARFQDKYREELNARFVALHQKLQRLHGQFVSEDDSPLKETIALLLRLFAEGPPEIWNTWRLLRAQIGRTWAFCSFS